MRLHRLALLLAAATVAACATAATTTTDTLPTTIPSDALMRHVSVLAADSMEGRRIGTPGGARARAYLVREFAAAGLQPVGTGFEHAFEVRGARDSSLRRGVNLVGRIPGRTNPERAIVISAHYDHVGIRNGEIYNGADDDASGTAALLEIARWFHANPPAHTLIFAAFDGEEGGLSGSKEFVRQPPIPRAAIVLNVNMDMIGRNVRNELYAAGTHHYPFLRRYVDSVVTRAPITLRLGHDDPSGPAHSDWTMQSDQASFHAAGIPFLYFGVEDHPDYHRPTDDAERLMPTFLAGAASTVLEVVRVLDRNLDAIVGRRR